MLNYDKHTELETGGRTYRIPGHMIDGLRNYFDHRLEPGHFLTAVLENDLLHAVMYADSMNLYALPAYANWLYNEAPSHGWGSKKKVDAWLSSALRPGAI